MGLFKLFTPKVDPLVSWRAEPGQTTEFDFDFDQHALCGIKPGDPISLLWKVGPSEDKSAEAEGFHNFYSKGVEVAVEDGKVVSFVLFFNDEQQKKFLPFKSRCTYRSRTIDLRPGLTESEIKTIFGEPYWCDEDEDETILFYEFGEVEWQVEIDRRIGLTAIVVLNPPLLADEAQRNSFHVTKPWPPQIN
jgi:hypothetical protein